MSVFNIKKNILALASFSVILFTSFAFSFFIPEKAMACSVALAKFTPSNVSFITDWYKDSEQPEIDVNIILRNSSKDDLCIGKNIRITLLEKDSVNLNFTQSVSFSEVREVNILVPDSNYISVKFRAGEEECEKTQGDSNDCEYSLKINIEDGTTFTTDGRDGGTLKYDCSGKCDAKWILDPIEKPWVTLDKKVDFKEVDTTFKPLVRLPGMPESFDTAPSAENPCPFGSYVNMIIKVLLGLYAVLAVIMIVKGGIEYMTSEISSSKEGGKRSITNAILGLAIALSAYLIINTINPRLLNVCFNNFPKATITIAGPDAGDDILDPDFARGGSAPMFRYATSPSLQRAIDMIKSDNWQINRLIVHASVNEMVIELKKDGKIDNTTKIKVLPGTRGYAPVGEGVSQDKKTPMGEWMILEKRYTPGRSQYNQKGSNMGYAFWRLDPMNTGERGIGIHGNKEGTLTRTNGCIRMYNSDMQALQEFVEVGTRVLITD